ncbi:MAG: polysaccharide deacetylase family protein [Chitinophagaceae bacterium]|nr:polysaccharide deacetylase family protein [Chitinophagaceae bacterium]
MNHKTDKNFDSGRFVISLDFELFWGVRDKKTIESYGENIKGVREALPAMIKLFDHYGVKTTISTVGFLFAKDLATLKSFLPKKFPEYLNSKLSPYYDITTVGNDENEDPYHFGYTLLKQVQLNSKHEIGTHTFSHYYCLEPGQTGETFLSDIEAAKAIANEEGVLIKSIIFPRNQYNNDYLMACKQMGIESYRGNPESWLYAPRNKNDESLFRRSLRLIDSYVNLTGHHCYSKSYITSFPIMNVAASRFLRPYSKRLSFLDSLRLMRIKRSMNFAAKNNKLYHLWWHPHNFGVNLKENLDFLENILLEFKSLERKYFFQSKTMSEIADEASR